jgi:soluble calcium-activated nucleotidase 1
MELSELVWFNGKLLSPDDRTGVVFSIEDGLAIPEYILMDGNGRTTKGFKSEWATVKDGLLYIGSVGKEWSDNTGKILSNNPLWIKVIDRNGKIEHRDWSAVYNKIRKAAGAEHPGYLMHEAVCWNPVLSKWFFLPRRHSTLPYNDEQDETRGSNYMITADESFQQIKVQRISRLDTSRGFSSCAFIPGRETHLIILKSQEVKDTISSFLGVVDVESGRILMEEQYIGDVKFEGVEIL